MLNSREVTRAVEELLAVKTTTDELETQRDKDQAPTSEDFPTIDAVIEYRKGFFIGQLADICRAHSEPTEADDPSCYPGTIGRLSKMGNGHPVAQLPLDVSEQLPVIFNSIVARTIQVAFAHCASYQEKRGDTYRINTSR